MILWLAACLLCFGLLLALAFWLPISVSCNVQGRAEPSGSWALAFGVGWGRLALTAIAATGVTPFVTCHAFGRPLGRVPLSRWFSRKQKQKQSTPGEPRAATPAANFSRTERALARFFRTLDPVDTLLSWWEKDRILEVSSLVVDVEYSFADVALTGQILAALYMLSGVLPERYVINQTPGWDSEDRVLLVADGRFRIWPGRLLVDLMGFVLEQRSRMRRSAVPASD